jgi:phage-related protein
MWKIEYYKTVDNKEPVKDWLSSFDNKTKTRIQKYFFRLERKKLNLKHTFIKHIETQLYEINILEDKRVLRIIFFPTGSKKLILLHAYTKNIPKKNKVKSAA